MGIAADHAGCSSLFFPLPEMVNVNQKTMERSTMRKKMGNQLFRLGHFQVRKL
jgi:hypothetical protein